MGEMHRGEEIAAPGQVAPVKSRRGRRQRLPHDAAPLTGTKVSAEKRLAWLMATNRLLGTRAEHTSQEDFADTLRAHGVTADNSRVSRWESGNQLVPAAVLSAYEELLGLPEAGLTAIGHCLRRANSATRPLPHLTPLPAAELDDAFELIDTGRAGPMWLSLATTLCAQEEIYLSPGSWRDLCGRLVDELSRAVGAARIRRAEAAHQLLGHPAARRHMLRAVGELVTDPDTQLVEAAISLLAEVTDPAASALLLRLVDTGTPLVHDAAANVLSSRLVRGLFSPDDMRRLEGFAALKLREFRFGPASLHAIDVATHLPDDSFQRLCGVGHETHTVDQLVSVRQSGLLLPPKTARQIARGIAGRAQEEAGTALASDPDPMLELLVTELLFHRHRERRRDAGMVLALSPYADAVADGCIGAAAAGPELVSHRALTALQTVGLGRDRSAVVRHATGGSTTALLQTAAANATAMGIVALDEDEADGFEAVIDGQAPDAVTQAALFALGMNAHHRIPRLTHHEDSSIAAQATWWHGHGGAVCDDDQQHHRAPVADPSWLAVPAPRRHK